MNRKKLTGLLLLPPLLNFVFHHSDDILRIMEDISRPLRGWWVWSSVTRPVIQVAKNATHPDVLLMFGFAVLVAVIVVGMALCLHILLVLVRKRNTRVFLSYQHEYEKLAIKLASDMTNSGINAKILSFLPTRDHDQLLEEIADAIRHCDLVVCLPGRKTSFVENEISMAMALDKPILFVSAAVELPELPNTAKKGYPVFLLERLRGRRFRPLLEMCSYLGADWRSTMNLYASVLCHIAAFGALNFFAFLVLVVMFGYLASPSLVAESATQSGVTEMLSTIIVTPAALGLMAAVVVLLLTPYAIFVCTRFVFRERLRRTVVGAKFAESHLPRTLGYSISRNDLLCTMYRGELLAHHEVRDLPAGWAMAADEGACSGLASDSCVADVVEGLHSDACPICGVANGSVDVHSVYRVWSVLFTKYSEEEIVSCQRCARRAQFKGIAFSSLFGWWGPWGIVYTPLQIVRNVIAIACPPDPAYPSGRLSEVVAEQLQDESDRPKQDLDTT